MNISDSRTSKSYKKQQNQSLHHTGRLHCPTGCSKKIKNKTEKKRWRGERESINAQGCVLTFPSQLLRCWLPLHLQSFLSLLFITTPLEALSLFLTWEWNNQRLSFLACLRSPSLIWSVVSETTRKMRPSTSVNVFKKSRKNSNLVSWKRKQWLSRNWLM